MPTEDALPGWRAAVVVYYRAMEQVARALMRAVARGMALEETTFDHAFEGGISTLRLLRYPVRSIETLEALGNPDLWVTHEGRRHVAAGHAHVDSGFMTLLAQDGVSGLQAQARNGDWIDVPPEEGTLAVNFGQVLERWTGGRLKATRHRVLGVGQERFSIPFFYEPRVDLEISPLPLPGVEPFEPFLFGDYLWATVTKFVEFHGMEGLRPPRRRVVVCSPPSATGFSLGPTWPNLHEIQKNSEPGARSGRLK
jgi:isopenicillin N synthase-like dioxygenase